MTAATEVKRAPLSIAQVIWFGLGAGAYATSFFLPAVSTPESGPLPGCFVAVLALNPLLLNKPDGILAMAGGLLNPVVLFYAAAAPPGRCSPPPSSSASSPPPST